MKSIKKGFTLIELLVVITIIGILATGAVTVFTSQIQKARDTTRINDVKSLQTAVEQSYQDEAEYPDATSTGFVDRVDAYIELIPQDPKFGQTCNDTGGATVCGYVYNVADDSGIQNGIYEVSTAFEAEGSVDSRAGSGSDNGQDDSRFELGISVSTVNTAVGNATADITAAQACGAIGASGALSLNKVCNP